MPKYGMGDLAALDQYGNPDDSPLLAQTDQTPVLDAAKYVGGKLGAAGQWLGDVAATAGFMRPQDIAPVRNMLPAPVQRMGELLGSPAANDALGVLGMGIMKPGPSNPIVYKVVKGAEASDPGYVYHATNTERAQSIINSGKMTRARPGDYTDQAAWPDGSIERRNYFTPTAKNTWQFAPEEGSPVLMRIPKDAHEFKAERYTGDLYSTKDVPASKIEALTENGWVPLIPK